MWIKTSFPWGSSNEVKQETGKNVSQDEEEWPNPKKALRELKWSERKEKGRRKREGNHYKRHSSGSRRAAFAAEGKHGKVRLVKAAKATTLTRETSSQTQTRTDETQ